MQIRKLRIKVMAQSRGRCVNWRATVVVTAATAAARRDFFPAPESVFDLVIENHTGREETRA